MLPSFSWSSADEGQGDSFVASREEVLFEMAAALALGNHSFAAQCRLAGVNDDGADVNQASDMTAFQCSKSLWHLIRR